MLKGIKEERSVELKEALLDPCLGVEFCPGCNCSSGL